MFDAFFWHPRYWTMATLLSGRHSIWKHLENLKQNSKAQLIYGRGKHFFDIQHFDEYLTKSKMFFCHHKNAICIQWLLTPYMYVLTCHTCHIIILPWNVFNVYGKCLIFYLFTKITTSRHFIQVVYGKVIMILRIGKYYSLLSLVW